MPENNCNIASPAKVELTRAQDIQSAVNAVERVNNGLKELNRRIVGADDQEKLNEICGEPILSEMLHGAPTRIRDLCDSIDASLSELEGQLF